MKTLIIDNYDSFTFNLFQLIAEVLGEEPVVVRNDKVTIGQIAAMDIEAIILSPGPGTPERPSDLGICAEILQHERRPILGVCLGHQAIARSLGADVTSAPEPMHGRLSQLHHDGRGLFKGIPSPFQVVRYHSLMVAEPLPEDLLVTARSDDGLIMALSHRDRPLWGVQFHPESVLSDHGARLIANFRDLVRQHQTRNSPNLTKQTATNQALSKSPNKPFIDQPTHSLTLRWTDSGLWIDPELAFIRLFGDSETAVWLDGSSGRRWSVMASGDDGQSRLLKEIADPATGAAHTIEIHQGNQTRHSGGILIKLRQILNDTCLRYGVEGEPPFPFRGGWLGQLGYEAENPEEFRPSRHPAYPDAQFLQPSWFLVFDHQDHRLYAASLSDEGEGGELQPVIDRLAGLAAGDDSLPDLPDLASAPRVPPQITRHFDDGAYGALIDECQRQLRAGESYEICLTNRVRLPSLTKPLLTLRLLRRLNPAPHAAYLRFGNLRILSASPEQFLSIDADGHVITKPIKGTRPRGRDSAEDEALRDDLACNEKDRSENLMIADLLRNDLGSVCRVGSVHVPKLMNVESFHAVHQLVTTVAGQLKPGLTAVDALMACFPGGSMTGAPKRRTMEIIDRLEACPRGVYSGSIGWIGFDGAADLNIVIRTMVDDGRTCEIGSGGAIVALSDRDEEIEETRVKARALLDAVAVANALSGNRT